MFNKEEQRVRALKFAAQQLSLGVPVPILSQPKPSPILPKRMHTQPITAVQHALKQKKEPKMAVSYSIEPFTNELDQLIRPGDLVVCVTQGYNHRVTVSMGTYLGLRRHSNGKVRNVVVQRTLKKSGYQLNGRPASYKTAGATYGSYTTDSRTSLPSCRIYRTLSSYSSTAM